VPRVRLIALLTPLLACGLAATANGAERVPVSAGVGVSAGVRVSASVREEGTPRHLVLTIARNGTVVYSRPVRASGCLVSCNTVAVPLGRSPVRVLDLDGDHEQDVVLGLFTGGANCCFLDQVFTFDPGTMTYVESSHDFLNAGAALERLGSHWVLRSGDCRITEAGFTDVADSGTPIQIWRFSARRFTDVTRRYSALIRTDAAKWLRLFNHHLSNGVGLIAAWAADEDLLGRSTLVDITLRSLAAHDKLRTPLGLPHNSETAFVAELELLLHKFGYTS
jgi:hypothetical protein